MGSLTEAPWVRALLGAGAPRGWFPEELRALAATSVVPDHWEVWEYGLCPKPAWPVPGASTSVVARGRKASHTTHTCSHLQLWGADQVNDVRQHFALRDWPCSGRHQCGRAGRRPPELS